MNMMNMVVPDGGGESIRGVELSVENPAHVAQTVTQSGSVGAPRETTTRTTRASATLYFSPMEDSLV